MKGKVREGGKEDEGKEERMEGKVNEGRKRRE